MEVIYKVAVLQNSLETKHKAKTIGFVPTMGALHMGHINLIEQSKKENELTICSIFVNKIQFNQPEDFTKYPRTLEADLALLKLYNCDIVFIPSHEEIYPAHLPLKTYHLGELEHILEGEFRPGHFQGVCNVVDRLLKLVNPSVLYLGIKDYQQCKVIDTMMKQEEFLSPILLRICETVREETGLALSSRNRRLSNAGLKNAVTIVQSLREAKQTIIKHPMGVHLVDIEHKYKNKLLSAGFESIDYFQLVDKDFNLLNVLSKQYPPVAILTAATIEGIRLIDNIEIQLNEY